MSCDQYLRTTKIIYLRHFLFDSDLVREGCVVPVLLKCRFKPKNSNAVIFL